MVKWHVEFHKDALKDLELLKRAKLAGKARELAAILEENPFQVPPPYEKLSGELQGVYSRRINLQHRLVYVVLPRTHTVRILRMWSHYGEN